MAAGVSKNQRVAKKAEAPVGSSGEQRFIVPLNGGKHAYVRAGRSTKHVATDSQAFVDAVTATENAAKVGAELDTLHATYPSHGWDAAKARLVESGVL